MVSHDIRGFWNLWERHDCCSVTALQARYSLDEQIIIKDGGDECKQSCSLSGRIMQENALPRLKDTKLIHRSWLHRYAYLRNKIKSHSYKPSGRRRLIIFWTHVQVRGVMHLVVPSTATMSIHIPSRYILWSMSTREYTSAGGLLNVW